MKQKLLKKLMLLLCALIVGSASAWADSYTITFSNSANSATGITTSTGANTTIASASRSYVNSTPYSNISGNCYYGGSTDAEKASIRIGKSGNNGSITIGLSDDGKVTATSIVVNCMKMTGSKNSNATLAVNGMTAQAAPASAGDLTFTFGSNTDIENIVLESVTAVFVYSITVNYTTSGNTGTATTTAISAPAGFVTDLNGNTGVSAGALTATVNPEGESALSSPAITWSSTNTSVATVNASTGAVTIWAVGSANIKAKYNGDETYEGSEGSYALTVTNSNPGDGSVTKPYTVAEALALISSYSSNSGSSGSVYTKGIVYSVGTLYNSTMLTYFISIDGTSTNTIQVFRGKNIGNTDFSSTDNLEAGDEVIIYGQLYKYNSTPEINTGNYIYSLNGKIKPTITFGKDSYEVAYNGSLTISATSTPSGTITYSSSDTDIAEINATTGVVTPKAEGEVTIRATLAEGEGNIEWYEEVELTVTDGRISAGIEFAQTSITTTWGESYTGQAVTNPNSLTVSYSSTVPAVATVDASTGEVTIVKAGTTTIKATFAGNSSYMSAEVSYTLTVNKAAAGLSFDETAFDIDLNDDSFEAPTLNNPNNLTVTWESNNTDVATVNASTGVLNLITTAEGSVTIKASFTTNDWYLAGNASYTITISDPNKKGTKRNPYTVAEVIELNPTSTNSATKTDVYVIGYIAGCVNTSTGAIVTSYVNSNLALVDKYDDTSDNISVQLANNSAPRTNFNLVDHPEYARVAKVLIKGDVYKYCGIPGLKNVDEMSKVAEAVTVTNAGYATWASDTPLDFTGKEIQAYIAEGKDGAAGVTFRQVYKIPANTGVLLYKAGGATVEIPVTTESTDYVASNVFVPGEGEEVASVVETTKHNYILNKVNDVVGFYRANDQTVAKNRAYIQIDESIWGSSSVKEFIALPGFNNVDGVESLTTSDSSVGENVIFNLAGQRMSKMQRGINIVNGKKVLVK